MSRDLNILMISHQRRFKAGGRSQSMATHLVQRGHRVSLVLVADHRRVGTVESEWDGVRIVETPDLLWGQLRSGWDPWNLLNRLLYLVRDAGPYDLLHCFETRPATIYPALFYRQRHGLPMLTDWNDWWGRGGLIDVQRPKWYRVLFGGFETYYEEAFRTRASGLTVISTALAERATNLGVPAERICYIPGGTLPNLFQARSKEECRNRIGLPLSDPILGFSSADSYWDLELVMQALALVAQEYPTVKLMVTGRAGETVMNMAGECSVEANIHLTGFVPREELPWYLGCADLFVLPFPDRVYNVGRWPNKLGGYMCLERPTVSNPVGDVGVLFRKHDVGLLAEWDPADFADKIIYLLKNPAAANQLGKKARELAVTKYSWRVLVCQLEDFYRKLLDMDRQS